MKNKELQEKQKIRNLINEYLERVICITMLMPKDYKFKKEEKKSLDKDHDDLVENIWCTLYNYRDKH